MEAPADQSGPPAELDPVVVIRSRPYQLALVLAALLGIPISAVAYGFLALVTKIQDYLFKDLPQDLFTNQVPAWWPVPLVALCGLLTGLTIRHLPGNCGHSPAFGFQTRRSAGRPRPARSHPCLAGNPQPGGGPRPRGATDRHRRRTGSADRPADQE